MASDIKNKVVVITGGARGIGFEIADKFLQRSARVIILDINETQGTKAKEDLTSKYGSDTVEFIKCDVTTDLEEVTNTIFDNYITVDVLVNNAGVFEMVPPSTKVIDVNVTALIQWTLKFQDHMNKRKGGNGGTIINVASCFGFRINHFVPVYQASKFAVMGFTKSLGHKYNYDRTDVRVVAVCPGYTESEMTANLNISEDKEVMSDFLASLETMERQTADIVGKAVVEIFERAESGTAWSIEGSKPIVEV